MLSLGAHVTYHLNQECTHVLVDQLMPVKEDIVDAIVAKKPIVLGSWVEVGQCSDHSLLFSSELCFKLLNIYIF